MVFVVLFGGLGSKRVKAGSRLPCRRQREQRQPHVPQLFVRETMARPQLVHGGGVFGEAKITPVGVWATSIIIVVGFCAAIATLCGLL